MTLIVDRIKALLEAAGIAVYLVEAPRGATYPYVLLWFTPGLPGIEPSVASIGDLSDLLGATYVDTTARNVLVLAEKARAVLDGATFTVSGLQVSLARSTSQTVRPDPDVVLPDTNAHPFYAVDRHQMVATPA